QSSIRNVKQSNKQSSRVSNEDSFYFLDNEHKSKSELEKQFLESKSVKQSTNNDDSKISPLLRRLQSRSSQRDNQYQRIPEVSEQYVRSPVYMRFVPESQPLQSNDGENSETHTNDTNEGENVPVNAKTEDENKETEKPETQAENESENGGNRETPETEERNKNENSENGAKEGSEVSSESQEKKEISTESSSGKEPETKTKPRKGTVWNIIKHADVKECIPAAYREFPRDIFGQKWRSRGFIIIHIAVVFYMFYCLAVVCDHYFLPSLEECSQRLNLSEDVAGATFMAAGSSAPELFTAILGVFIAKGDVGTGTIVGSAVFNILFVIGLCGILAGKYISISFIHSPKRFFCKNPNISICSLNALFYRITEHYGNHYNIFCFDCDLYSSVDCSICVQLFH
ncbi:Sodium/potassium/calcium exchanger-like protein, partial [Leptotrombidium deliense]